MNTFSTLRALILAVALSLPLAQAAMAGQQEQQASADQSTASGSFISGGAYNNDAVMSPAVGD